MEYILTAKQMQAQDAETMERFQMPSCVLMEKAALGVLEEIEKRNLLKEDTIILCGSGNNGGDGLALARLLLLLGKRVTVFLIGETDKLSIECARQLAIYQSYCQVYRGSIIQFNPKQTQFEDLHLSADLLVDALFGIGLSRDISGIYADIIAWANQQNCKKVAIDIPSGVSADTGDILGLAFQSDLTVTMAYAKPGLFLYPGREFAGELVVKDIGIKLVNPSEKSHLAHTFTSKDLTLLPVRKPDSNKGSYGKVLCVAGAVNMAGAACFCAKAAYRSGAGLVSVYTDERNREIVQKTVPEAVLTTYSPEAENYQKLEEIQSRASVLLLGPGLSTEEEAGNRLQFLLSKEAKPLVMDADALNLLASEKYVTKQELRDYDAEIVITPHLGEAARLLGCSVSDIKKDRILAAKALSEKYHCICVLKDAATLVCHPNGELYINTSGNQGMSTGGSGDVLAGMIAGFLAQGADAFAAARLGVYLHGNAGDLAAKKYSMRGMTAWDLLDALTDLFCQVETNNKENSKNEIFQM